MHSLLLLPLLPLALAAPAKPSPPAAQATPAPLLVPRAPVIANKYIVKYKPTFSTTTADHTLEQLSAGADRVYETIFRGFSGTLNESTVEALRQHPDVEYIEKDAIFTVNGFVEQTGAPWGLNRVSHHAGRGTDYVYDDSAGAGTCSYIIDTGVDDSHADFEGRAQFIRSFVDGQNTDGHGHGTHVAGTIGSRSYGVAKKTQLLGIKVLSDQGSGSGSDIVAGMDFAVQDARQRSGCGKGALANMSLGGGFSQALNDAAAQMIREGVFLAVAAGNSHQDAAGFSPASEPTVCTVGATDSADRLSSFSNFGSVVDVLAPGSGILSTWPGGST
ncbi:hypothetical protein E4U43_001378, partial [Claviceps pusilla]